MMIILIMWHIKVNSNYVEDKQESKSLTNVANNSNR